MRKCAAINRLNHPTNNCNAICWISSFNNNNYLTVSDTIAYSFSDLISVVGLRLFILPNDLWKEDHWLCGYFAKCTSENLTLGPLWKSGFSKEAAIRKSLGTIALFENIKNGITQFLMKLVLFVCNNNNCNMMNLEKIDVIRRI